MAHIGHFVGDDQMVAGIHRALHVVANDASAAAAGGHGTGIRSVSEIWPVSPAPVILHIITSTTVSTGAGSHWRHLRARSRRSVAHGMVGVRSIAGSRHIESRRTAERCVDVSLLVLKQ